MFETSNLEGALELLGQLVADRGLSFDAVAIGGGGLLLLGVIERPTKDLDLVALVVDDHFVRSRQVAPTRARGSRCRRRARSGVAGQLDDATADDRPNGKHHADLKRLAPTREELVAAAHWTRTHDSSDGFAVMLAGVLRSFGVTDAF